MLEPGELVQNSPRLFSGLVSVPEDPGPFNMFHKSSTTKLRIFPQPEPTLACLFL